MKTQDPDKLSEAFRIALKEAQAKAIERAIDRAKELVEEELREEATRLMAVVTTATNFPHFSTDITITLKQFDPTRRRL